MSEHLTQPKEINITLSYMNNSCDIDAETKFTDQAVNSFVRKNWSHDVGHTSAYRAAYMKSHQLSKK